MRRKNVIQRPMVPLEEGSWWQKMGTRGGCPASVHSGPAGIPWRRSCDRRRPALSSSRARQPIGATAVPVPQVLLIDGLVTAGAVARADRSRRFRTQWGRPGGRNLRLARKAAAKRLGSLLVRPSCPP
jgi:hypothetical protein